MPNLSKRAAVEHHVRAAGWRSIGRQEWQALKEEFPGTSENTLRSALADLGLAVEQPFAGVATKTLEDLERSLLALAVAYPLNQAECRGAVIAAKDRMRFAARNPRTAPEKRTVKEEMVEWMLVWLGDPGMFAPWVALRKRAVRGGRLSDNLD